jgi:predicted ATPase
MPHWKSLHIERFRRLENVRLDNLGAINLLVGKNNSGKTSILEALAILANPLNPGTWIDVAWKREIKSSRTPIAEVIKWLFPSAGNFPTPGSFESSVRFTSGLADNDETWVVQADAREFLSYHEDTPPDASDDPSIPVLDLILKNWREAPEEESPFGYDETRFQITSGQPIKVEAQPPRQSWPVQFITPVSHRTETEQIVNLSKALEQHRRAEIVALLKIFMPHVESVEIVSIDPRNPRVKIQGNGYGSQPLSVQGDGLRRALVLATSVSFATGGFLLIDEIETALHPDVLEEVMRSLVAACRRSGIQLFATTHSLEAVDAVIAATDGAPGDLVVYRLPSQGSGNPLKRFGSRTVRDLRNEGGLDLR